MSIDFENNRDLKNNCYEIEETNDDEYIESFWNLIPEPILLNIFYCYLVPREILNAGETCNRWDKISKDDFLWNKIFHRDFNVSCDIGLKPGSESWYSEYKRLTYHTPMVLTEVLSDHGNQVIHVSFSHNGKMFATCSKDGSVIIWNSAYPASIKYSHDMKRFCWKYTQFSQFNQSDTLLLVSGVHFGTPHSTSGEIAVFSVDGESHLRCRVGNRPYDIFGTWFSDQYLISGDLHWLAHFVNSSILFLNKADQETSSERLPVMNQLYKFYNTNASWVRAIKIANCPWLLDKENTSKLGDLNSEFGNIDRKKNVCKEEASNIPYQKIGNKINVQSSTIHFTDEYRKKYNEQNYYDDYSSDDMEPCENSSDNDFDDDEEDDEDDEDDELDNFCPKYLIFTTGTKTYTPHLIGIKRIDKVNFPKKIDRGLSLKDRIALREIEKQTQNTEPELDWLNYEMVQDKFDKIDKLIDLHGHIIGMGLSPDHRYLYVNSRSWPSNYIISDPLEPPPIAQEIDIHVIDLETLSNAGVMLRSHKAYTPNTECFYIFLDVCDNYVASGAEDLHAYIWDRFYGICLAKFQHSDVVDSVAFNPKDSEMLVTTSDDHKIKIWRSVSKAKLLNTTILNRAVQLRKTKT